jgi:hypothetical protein
MRNNTRSTIVPALATILCTPRIPHRIKDAVNTPGRAQNRRDNGKSEARNEHCAEGGNVVLVEVLVGALSGVEGE